MMTLDELKARLNERRTNPAWKEGWLRRGAQFGAVIRCIRDMLELAADKQRIGADDAVQGWIKHILDYAAYKHWDEQASKPRPFLPPGHEIITAEEAAADFATRLPAVSTLTQAQVAWMRFVFERVDPDKTFGQARVLYYRRTGDWAEWDWPGMPRSKLDRMAPNQRRTGRKMAFCAERRRTAVLTPSHENT
jgi:hypothetical protein